MRAVIVVVVLMLSAQSARADRGEPWDGTTIALQVGGGTTVGLVSGAVVGLAGAGIGMLIEDRNWGVPLAGALLGGVTGAFVGTILGVHLVGDARGLDGRPWVTTLGAAVGAGGAAAFGYFAADGGNAWFAEVALGYVIFLTPTVVAYHLGADSEAGAAERRFMLPMMSRSF